MKIGIIKEGKIPVDRRVPLLPEACEILKQNHPELEIFIQPSNIRCVFDDAYQSKGFELKEDLSDCDVLLGVKEVNIEELLDNKTYFFFSHTIKEQAYNRKLLQSILNKNINLIDYECLTNNSGSRIVAFGRFAGIVGAYNGILTYGQKHKLFDLRPAHTCKDLQDLASEYSKVKLPNIKIVLTGGGRVSNGAIEVLKGMNIKEVSTEAFLNNNFNEAVFTQIHSAEYYIHKDGKAWNKEEFYKTPENYISDFYKFAKVSDVLISGHFWNYKADKLFTVEDVKKDDFKINVIADITCDIEGSIPTTLRATTIDKPIYDYDPINHQETTPYKDLNKITVMAVDNLPCELPVDASKSFGEQLIKFIFPALLNGDKDNIISKAMITNQGKLTDKYSYLENYVKGI